MGGERPGEVRVAAMVVIAARQQPVGVGVAARADDVVHAGAVLVPAVPGKRVMGDRRHRAQIGQGAPQPVAGRDVRRVQRARLAAEEALAEIVVAPQVEIADLRPLDADDAKEMTLGNAEGSGIARGNDDLGDRRETLSRAIEKVQVRLRQRSNGIDDDRRRSPPGLRVVGGRGGGSPHGNVSERNRPPDTPRRAAEPGWFILPLLTRLSNSAVLEKGAKAGSGQSGFPRASSPATIAGPQRRPS